MLQVENREMHGSFWFMLIAEWWFNLVTIEQHDVDVSVMIRYLFKLSFLFIARFIDGLRLPVVVTCP